MVGNLAHNVVDKETARTPLGACHSRKNIHHQVFFVFGCFAPMLPKHGHRGIAGVAIKNREFERVGKIAITLGVIAQFAQIAFTHGREFILKNQERIRAECRLRNTGLLREGP
jgi:hypothetical protein